MLKDIDFKYDDIFNLRDEDDFLQMGLRIFRYQARSNKIYSEFINSLGVDPEKVLNLSEIPFLPVDFFKSHMVISGDENYSHVFSSSGTTGQITSRHYVKEIDLYKKSFKKSFRLFYGSPDDWCILALLPSYLERQGSSLVFMTEELIKASGNKKSGFYLHDFSRLDNQLKENEQAGIKTLLLGVSFALLDFSEQFPQSLNHTIVMETGGMKGRRKELVREELHEQLKKGFGVKAIHSEYGMTELLSQAYSKGEGKYFSPPWIRIIIREMNDPFAICGMEKTGGVNVIDLANIHSCSFIGTSDLGKTHSDGSFEILGRFDFSDIRGCSLMV